MSSAGRSAINWEAEVDGELCQEWRATIPDGVSMRDRLQTLIELDTALAMDDLDAASLRLVDLKADRVANRAQQAQDALERGDPDRAAEVCAEIGDVARSLTVGFD